MNVLVLGIGNILLSDEGIGVRVVEALEEQYRLPPGVECVDGGTSGFALMDLFEGRDHVLIVDAIVSDAAPGTVVKLVDREVPTFFQARMTPHQIGLSDVLAALMLLDRGPKALTLLGIVPASLELSVELSPTLKSDLDGYVERVAQELNVIGVPVNRR